jgi:hypothetical protein
MAFVGYHKQDYSLHVGRTCAPLPQRTVDGRTLPIPTIEHLTGLSRKPVVVHPNLPVSRQIAPPTTKAVYAPQWMVSSDEGEEQATHSAPVSTFAVHAVGKHDRTNVGDHVPLCVVVASTDRRQIQTEDGGLILRTPDDNKGIFRVDVTANTIGAAQWGLRLGDEKAIPRPRKLGSTAHGNTNATLFVEAQPGEVLRLALLSHRRHRHAESATAPSARPEDDIGAEEEDLVDYAQMDLHMGGAQAIYPVRVSVQWIATAMLVLTDDKERQQQWGVEIRVHLCHECLQFVVPARIRSYTDRFL